MDQFEKTLTEIVDHFVCLQQWREKPEAVRKPTEIFSSIIAVDQGLKSLKHCTAPKFETPTLADKADTLQSLAREIRTAFDTREFRAVRLAAFNWRSALRRVPKRAKQKVISAPTPKERPVDRPRPSPIVARGKTTPAPPQQRSGGRQQAVRISPKSTKPRPTRLTAEQNVQQRENSKKFVRDFMAFLDSIPEQTRRELRAHQPHVDIYSAGKRLAGSFGTGR